nr:DUF3570 domain-containing protein [Muriicola sp. Z0-33]
MKKIIALVIFVFAFSLQALDAQSSTPQYQKRILEATEVDFLSSYYSQDGDNAAVSGGIGTEELTDITGTVILSIPLNDNDVLTIDAGVSAYTSASSSNVNPFDSSTLSDPFVATSGASGADTWANLTGSYSHSSEDRNTIWSARLSVATEYDYFSAGLGGSYTRLFNEKNTELSISANVYIDNWNTIYPFELRPFGISGDGINDTFFTFNTISGNANYAPAFTAFESTGRNSYSVGLGFSQILSKNAQASVMVDLVQQSGLLSTPFQRVYFSDVADSFIENFQLADDIERLPDARFKVALGGRLNYYINETFVLRTYYRYYIDDWGINSHTASLEIPIKITDKFTLYPSYRYYRQTAADYFAGYEGHLSTDNYYTSDYDLSDYSANQFGFGASYTDIFTKLHIWKFGLKSIDLKFIQYDRSNTLSSYMITTGFKFVFD